MNSPAPFGYYFTLKHNGRARVKNPFRCLISISAVATLCISAIGPKSAKGQAPAESVASSPAQIRALKITVLSTMLVGETAGLGEWGFSALVEADGHRILLDAGGHPETVLQNARDLNIDLSDVSEAILTHNHWDHVRGLMPLRREMMKKNPAAALGHARGPNDCELGLLR